MGGQLINQHEIVGDVKRQRVEGVGQLSEGFLYGDVVFDSLDDVVDGRMDDDLLFVKVFECVILDITDFLLVTHEGLVGAILDGHQPTMTK